MPGNDTPIDPHVTTERQIEALPRQHHASHPSWSPDGPPPEVRAALDDPDARIGPYVIVGELGRGGMGVVYRAHQLSLNRYVAIKMILSRPSEHDVKRFRREAETVARLRHPGIVAVHEVGQHEDRPYLVMELVDGESLEHTLIARPMPPRRVAEVIRGVALALAHAHKEGIVHRDVKPENILIDRAGEPRLTDFGLARDLHADQNLTATGQMIGTPAFMAPEQAGGHRSLIGPTTDVYALGGVLYRALTGRPPFTGASMLEIARRVVSEDPEPPRSIERAVHPDLETIILKCLEKDPARRYPTAGAVADELRRFLDGVPISARPVGRITKARRWVRRHRLATAGLSAVVVLVASLVAVGSTAAVNAARRERAALIAQAQEELDAAADAFQRERAAVGASTSIEERRANLDRVLAAGLDALGASERLHALRPSDPAALQRRFDVALDLGAVALETEQWSVASSAFEKALDLGLDDARARAEIARVASERNRAEELRRTAVAAALDEARSGKLSIRGVVYERALFSLVGHGGPGTVVQLAEALDRVTERLRKASRAKIVEAAAPTDPERLAGHAEIVGLAESVDAWLVRDRTLRDGALPPAIAQAAERLEMRSTQGHSTLALFLSSATGTPLDPHATSFRELLATAQELGAGRAGLALARLVCDALARIGIREGAVEPIGRYLMVEADPGRARTAAIALCELGGPRALHHVVQARRRFGANGPFWRTVQRSFVHLDAPVPALENETALALFERGVVRRDRGDLAGALDDLERAAALDPEDAAAWNGLGIVYRDLDRGADAERAYTRSIEANPDPPHALCNRADFLVDRGHVEQAIADVNRAVEIAPRAPVAWAARASVLLKAERWDEAHDSASRAIRLEPDFPLAWYVRGLARAGRAGVTPSVATMEGAITDFTHAVDLDPGWAHAWAYRAQLRRSLGDEASAISDATRAIDLDPDVIGAWICRAKARLGRGELAAALADIDEVTSRDPRSVDAWHVLGTIRQLAGELEAAAEAFGRAIEINDAAAMSFYHRGFVKKELGRLDEALIDYDFAFQRATTDPERANILNGRAIVRELRGDLRGALADFDQAIILAPEQAGVIEANRANLLARLGDWSGAEAAFDRAVETNPEQASVWTNRGIARMRRGELDRARSDLERAAKLAPRSIVIWINLAQLHAARRDAVEATAAMDRARALSPEDVGVLVQSSMLKEGLKNLPGAREDAERAVELAPRNALAIHQRGRVLLAQGQVPGGIRDLQTAVELAPEQSPFWFSLGYALTISGNPAGGASAFERSIELDPSQPNGYFFRATMIFLSLGAWNDPVRAAADLRSYLRVAPPNDPNRAQAQTLLEQLPPPPPAAGD